jgi:hypothetical protein
MAEKLLVPDKRIILVDDDIALRDMILHNVCEVFPGFEIISYDRVNVAQDDYLRGMQKGVRPALIFSDNSTPGPVKGKDFYISLREQKKDRATPFILASGDGLEKSDPEFWFYITSDPRGGFLDKPCDLSLLRAMLDKVKPYVAQD